MSRAALDRVRREMAAHRDLFRLDLAHLGRDLCKAATDGVQANFAAERDPDGTPWPPLSAAYDEWKGFQHPGQPIGVLHGVMADPREVAGEVAVSAELARVTYGVSEQARAEAEWFQQGGDGRPPRRFWGLTAESEARSREILDARFRTIR